jgi:dihydroflavonol-4-reductase
MRVFLTGGTGFIGRALTRTLRAQGWQVTALVRRPSSAEAQELAALGAELAAGDVTDRESMRVPMRGADAVIHNAGIYAFGVTPAEQQRMHAVNVTGTEHTLGLAHELGVPRIVHVSSVVAFGPTGNRVADETFQRQVAPASPYEQTKTDAHMIAERLQAAGAPVVIVCPASVIGPGDHASVGHLIRLYVRGMLPPLLYGTARQTFVHVDDLAEAMMLATVRGQVGASYMLASGVLSVPEMLAIWRQVPGGMATLGWMSRTPALLFSVFAEMVAQKLGLPVIFSREFTREAFETRQFSAARAERELGAQFRSVERVFLDTLAAEAAHVRGNS